MVDLLFEFCNGSHPALLGALILGVSLVVVLVQDWSDRRRHGRTSEPVAPRLPEPVVLFEPVPRPPVEERAVLVDAGRRLWSLVADGRPVLVTGERYWFRGRPIDVTVVAVARSSGRRFTLRARTSPLPRPKGDPLDVPLDEFTAGYQVWGPRARVVRRGLSSDARTALLNCLSMRPLVEVRPDIVTARFADVRHPGPQVPGVIASTLAFAAGLRLERMIVWDDELAPTGLCSTCFAPAEADLRVCPSCRAVQHADCWEFVGGCSTYACGRARRRA